MDPAASVHSDSADSDDSDDSMDTATRAKQVDAARRAARLRRKKNKFNIGEVSRETVAKNGAKWAVKHGWNTCGHDPAFVALSGLDSLVRKGYLHEVE